VIKTGYSFRVAAGHLPDVISRIKEIDWTVAPMADRCSTYGFTRWTKLCEKEGLRPVYGVELGVTQELGAKKQTLDFWQFLAVDSLRPLHDLIYQATGNPGRLPSLTYEQALAAPGLIKITGHTVDLASLPQESREDLFVGLSPAMPRGLVRRALSSPHRLVAAQANLYPRATDKEFYRVTLGMSATTQTYPLYILSDEEWMDHLASYCNADILVEALETRCQVLDRCHATLKKATLLTPEKPKSLRQLCEEGATRTGCNLSRPAYAARLDRELELIAEKDFEDYFFVVADIMRFARENMVVGPARGSSCGSLVCYLLGITAIDPIPFDLVFERFIDVTRTDLPDIDLDFSDAKRHLVFEYVSEKYGRERSARLGSVNMLKSKSAMNQLGTSLRIPKSRIKEINNTLIKRSEGDARARDTIDDTFEATDVGQKFIKEYPEARIATRIEGHPAAAAQHAAGVVLTQEPVTEFVAVDRRTGATMCDKKDAEVLNLLKIDALGLIQLSIFERCLELIGEEPRSEFLEAIPLDDQAAFDILNDGKFSGIFQFVPGSALTNLLEQFKELGGSFNHIEDMVSFTALVRPGPLKSGATAQWMRRRAGCEETSYPHPGLEPYLKTTRGIVVYQEQVLAIGREVGDLSWEDVTALRKAMSRSLGKEFFDQYGDRWKAGAKKNIGLEGEAADRIWDDLCTYGSWAFNRSHSVAYAVVSYWCCWLKAHHPVEFAAATLDAQTEPFQQIEALRELRQEGVDYVPIDADKSTDRWTITQQGDGKVLVGPLTNIRGIGPKTMIEIMDSRRTGLPLKASIAKKLDGAKTSIDSLTPIGDVIDTFDLKANNIASTPVPCAKVPSGSNDVLVIAVVTRVSPGDENDPDKVSKRGRALSGPTKVINLFVRDDSGEIFCKIGRFDFQRFGQKFLEEAKQGKSIYAIKGRVPPGFKAIFVNRVRYLGETELSFKNKWV
jgi:DNA polymerase III alpha subunit